jgi:hypothetical protein
VYLYGQPVFEDPQHGARNLGCVNAAEDVSYSLATMDGFCPIWRAGAPQTVGRLYVQRMESNPAHQVAAGAVGLLVLLNLFILFAAGA